MGSGAPGRGRLTAGYALQTYGLRWTTASNAGFITSLFVVITSLLGTLLFGRRIGRRSWAGDLAAGSLVPVIQATKGPCSVGSRGRASCTS
ncbi:MAG: EamA family transporter [Gemmatimonadota bacterium]